MILQKSGENKEVIFKDIFVMILESIQKWYEDEHNVHLCFYNDENHASVYVNNELASPAQIFTPACDKDSYVDEVNRTHFPNNNSPCIREESIYFLNESHGDVPRGVSLSKMKEMGKITKCRIVYQGELLTCTDIETFDWISELWTRWNEKYEIKQ